MSWAGERRFTYALGTSLLLLLIVGGGYFFFSYQPATCGDGKQNGSETGVDCGGVCERLCAFEVAEARVLWSRSFEVAPGRYNAVAYVENPNKHAGIRVISYVFRLVDADNTLITEREGTTFITPNGISPVFEADINTGERAPARTFFEFAGAPEWYRATESSQSIAVTSKQLIDTATRPRIDATLVNNSLEEFKNLEVVGVVFAADGNAVAASRTVIDLLEKRGSKSIVFTWPHPFKKQLEQCVVPADVMLLLDTSGSMNDEGGTPPQPIAAAKAAAVSFLGRLLEGDRAGVVVFATAAEVLERLTPDKPRMSTAVAEFTIRPEEERGRTNIADALALADETLESARRTEQYSRVIILLTDGRANAPTEATAETQALAEASKVKLHETAIYTIGLGSAVNQAFLENIASSPAHAYRAASGRDLEAIYREISTAICERGPAVIDITPRSLDMLVKPSPR